MTTTATDIDTVRRITTAEEAERLGLAAYDAIVDDLERLDEADWATTTVCDPWTVADVVRHLIGAAKANASLGELLRQQIHGIRHKAEFDDNALDALNHLQVEDHRHLGPDVLPGAVADVAEPSVRGRIRRASFVGWMQIPIDMSGSTAEGMPSRVDLGELMRVILTRDVWLHRIDIARAVGSAPDLDPDVDGRLIEDVAKEWADRHGEPFDLHLTGPAGGRYLRPGSGPSIEIDAVEFCWILSGRGEPEPSRDGARLLRTRVLF